MFPARSPASAADRCFGDDGAERLAWLLGRRGRRSRFPSQAGAGEEFVGGIHGGRATATGEFAVLVKDSRANCRAWTRSSQSTFTPFAEYRQVEELRPKPGAGAGSEPNFAASVGDGERAVMASVEAERDPRMSRVVTGHDRSEGIWVEEQRLGGGPVGAAERSFGGGARFQQHRVPYAFGFGGQRRVSGWQRRLVGVRTACWRSRPLRRGFRASAGPPIRVSDGADPLVMAAAARPPLGGRASRSARAPQRGH